LARGWESKAVADQIEDSSDKRAQQQTPVHSSEERERKERLTSLKLSKSRLLEQLERARYPAHREGLLKGLKAIESEIEQLTTDRL
jgi:hypothetical protein